MEQICQVRRTSKWKTSYDYLVVGAGLYGAVFAYEAKKKGKSCLVIDKRPHIAGNVYCENVHGINVHKSGAHIFHTSDKKIWDYVNQFAEFNHYINSPSGNIIRIELYNLPFNMNTFSKMWGVRTPEEAQKKSRSRLRVFISQSRRIWRSRRFRLSAQMYTKS